MKFFLPHSDNDAQAEEVYGQIKANITKETLNDAITERRIHSIRFVHDGVSYSATVGETFDRLGEPVIALFEGSLYYLCTANRGVLRGGPYFIGREEVRSITDFDRDSSQES
jgi:hypothetical protein